MRRQAEEFELSIRACIVCRGGCIVRSPSVFAIQSQRFLSCSSGMLVLTLRARAASFLSNSILNSAKAVTAAPRRREVSSLRTFALRTGPCAESCWLERVKLFFLATKLNFAEIRYAVVIGLFIRSSFGDEIVMRPFLLSSVFFRPLRPHHFIRYRSFNLYYRAVRCKC